MKEPLIFEAHDSYILNLLVTSDGKTLVSSGMDNTVKLWDTSAWQLVKIFAGHENSVNTIALAPDETFLASGSSDNSVKIWTFPEGKVIRALTDRKKTVSAVDISADGRWISAASYGGRVVIWTFSGDPVLAIKASKKNLSTVGIRPDNRMVATAGLGEDIYLFSLPDGKLLETFTGHKIAVGEVKFIQEGRTLLSLGYEQVLNAWDVETGKVIHRIDLAGTGIRGFSLSHDESLLALHMESRVELWSVDSWEPLAEFEVGTKVVNATAISPDGKWLAVGSADKKIRVWSLDAI